MAMKPFHCKCGMTLRLKEKNAEAATGRHLSSKVHTYRRKVAKLLSKSDLRHSEIALQLGITLKDVSWIAKTLGALNGVSRWSQRAAVDRLARWWNTAGKHPVILKCQELGFVVEPFMAEGSNNYFRRTLFLVNGHRVVCLLIQPVRDSSGNAVWSFRAKQEPGANFQVGKAGKSFYIFPQALLAGLKRVTFVDNSALPNHLLSKRLPYDRRDYQDAWHLLATPKRGWHARPGTTRGAA